MRDEKRKESLEARVLRFIREQRLVTSGETLVIGVSGGPDSICLLHTLVNLRETLSIHLHIAHLDHALRGEESTADARYVATLAEKLGIPATIVKEDVRAYQAEKRLTLEEAAREVRYSFLARVAESVRAGRVVVGHTRDDNIETILLHIIRGTGTRGLRGLLPVSPWPYPRTSTTLVRPLLPVSREETLAYCRQHNLAPRLDTSNLSLSPLRNRVRLELLPILEGYNPRIREALLRTARIAGDDLAYLDMETALTWAEVARMEGDAVIIDRQGFLRQPPALQRNLLRMAVEAKLGTLKDIEARHIEEMMETVLKPAGRKIHLPGGLIFSVEYERYLLGPEPEAIAPYPPLEGEYALTVPGLTVLPGWRVEATVTERAGTLDRCAGAFTACLDFDRAGNVLAVRGRRRGDRFQPLGLGETKKLGEFMIDARIPQAWRDRVPIVVSPRGIVWVAGWRIDEKVRVTPETMRVLRLDFECAKSPQAASNLLT